MTAVITHARGRAFVFIDSDMQLDPEEFPTLLAEFDRGDDIVSGVRKNRRDSLLRVVPSKLANAVMRRVARHDLTDFGCTFKIFRTAYVFSRAGRVKEVPVTHHERRYGRSGWTFRKLFAFYMDHLVGLSERPFQLLSLSCLLLAGLFGLRLLASWPVPLSILAEVTPGLILNVIVLGLLLLLGVLSLIGEYVMRNFLMLQRYPGYVVRELRQKESAGVFGG